MRHYFDSVSRDYATLSAKRPWSWLRAVERDNVIRLINIGKERFASMDVLDLGCGSGYYAEVLYGLGARTVSVMDHSAEMLAQIRVPVHAKILADGQNSFGDERYDLVTCCGMLEFCDNPSVVVKNIARALRPGGRAILLVPRKNTPGNIYRRFHLRHQISAHLFNAQDIRTLSADGGFKLERLEGVFPMTWAAEFAKPGRS